MMTFEYSPTWTSAFLWAVIAAFIVSFLFSYGMGANDCANSWATSVSSGVVKLWQAYILANILNTLGAVLVGYQVTDTIRNGIFQLDTYNVYSEYNSSADVYVQVANCSNYTIDIAGISQHHPACTEYTSADYMLGELAAITGGAIWMIFASVTRMPVSATHSIVGASLGFSLVVKGSRGIRWMKIVNIVLSWIASPVLAGIFSASLYLVIKFGVMLRADPFESALNAVPYFIAFMLSVDAFSILFNGSKYLGFDKIPWWAAALISLAIGTIAASGVQFLLRGWMRRRAIRLADNEKRIDPEASVGSRNIAIDTVRIHPDDSSNIVQSQTPTQIDDDADKRTISTSSNGGAAIKKLQHHLSTPISEHALAQKVFNVLQVMSACFLQFSHGSNDTANGIAPLVGIWQTYRTGRAGSAFSSPRDIILFMLFGAVSQVIGLSTLGHRVMRTIGKDITDVSAPSGFAVELGAAFTVLLASRLGIPVSTTHCAVGAVVFVGLVKSGRAGVEWKVFLQCILAWVVTLPASGLLAAGITYLFVHFVTGTA